MRNSISVLYYSCLSVFKIPWKLVGGRVIYSMVYFLFGVLCWVLRVYSSTILDWISVINVCDNEERCSGTLAVYRFSFALAVRNSNSNSNFLQGVSSAFSVSHNTRTRQVRLAKSCTRWILAHEGIIPHRNDCR